MELDKVQKRQFHSFCDKFPITLVLWMQHTIASRQLFEPEYSINYACRVALIWGSHINIITYVAIYQRVEGGGVMTLSKLGKAIMAHTHTHTIMHMHSHV